MKRHEFLGDVGGREAARLEVQKVLTELKKHAEATKSQYEGDERSGTIIRERGFSVTVANRFENGQSQLLIQVWDGQLLWLHKPTGDVLRRELFTFDVERPNIVGWRNGSKFLTSAHVAEDAVTWLLDAVEADEKQRRQKR